MAEKIYTVAEITRQIQSVIESNFPILWVVGEVSGYTLHSSGHQYFTLKDAHSQLSCVLWRGRGANVSVRIRNGLKTTVQGRLTVYEKGGRYQFDVYALQLAGIGELAIAYEQLKKKLADEGLFDVEKKRPIPIYPKRIGIVTSLTGAAIRDIVTVASRRWKGIELILRPAQVQGDDAAEDIAEGIKEFNQWGHIDVMIVGRGGGSLEDLWAFNEEPVVRAVADSKVPIVSAVGHEVDITLCDLVADLRAPTPSAAAELVIKDARELSLQLQQVGERSSMALAAIFDRNRDRLKALANHWALQRPVELVRNQNQRLDEMEQRFRLGVTGYITKHKEQHHRLETALKVLDPSGVLRRGYSITRRLPENQVVRDNRSVSKGDKLSITLHHGGIEAEVLET